MFINFWYAAALSRELGTKPLKVRMLGRNFALFRDAKGVAHCLANVCPHRFGSLGQGWVRGDHIACPYHGWEFDGDGQCRRIPSLGPDQALPPAAALDRARATGCDDTVHRRRTPSRDTDKRCDRRAPSLGRANRNDVDKRSLGNARRLSHRETARNCDRASAL